MFNPDLIKYINSGRCLVLVGAGPSCEIGYPSWCELAKTTIEHVYKTVQEVDKSTYDTFLKKQKFPEIFRQAEIDLGSRQSLIEFLKVEINLNKKTIQPNSIYSYLTKWPFACYLTTNFDNELQKYLENDGEYYRVLKNGKDDMIHLRDGANHLIFKIHSDLSEIEEAVITSKDYDRIESDPLFEYLRDKLKSAFHFFNILIVGHSISDPDLRLLMKISKWTAGPTNPIFMILSNCSAAESRELNEQYNIQVIPYDNSDGKHAQLKRLLAVVDLFIAARTNITVPNTNFNSDQESLASSLLLYRKLRLIKQDNPMYLGPILLSILANFHEGLSVDQIKEQSILPQLLKSEENQQGIEEALKFLCGEKLAEAIGIFYKITPKGQEQTKLVSQEREDQEHKAFGQFLLQMKRICPNNLESFNVALVKAAKFAIVNCFSQRGLTMAHSTFTGQSLHHEDLPDIFSAFKDQSLQFSDFNIRAAFIESAKLFITEPNLPQKNYLTNISQGFFLFHMVGLDPNCSRVRNSIFKETYWFIDSSVILPLIAIGCNNNEYATDFFLRLKSLNATIFTTPRLLKEAMQHLEWAETFFKNNSIDSQQFLEAAVASHGYKENLFIDGYIRLSAEGDVGTTNEYLQKVFFNGKKSNLLEHICKMYNILLIDIEKLSGFDSSDQKIIDSWSKSIEERRRNKGTFRNIPQVTSEAEILQIIHGIRTGKYKIPALDTKNRAYFISQSHVLNEILSEGPLITWTPEAVYRYANSLNGDAPDPNFFQQCMLNEYFYTGVSIIDKSHYLKFFGPTIRQAKFSYNEQVEKYLQEIEQSYTRSEVDDLFEKIPDLQKPFFVTQMGWKLARITEERSKQLSEDAEKRAKEAETTASSAKSELIGLKRKLAKADNEIRRLRNKQDPKHVQKKRKQAKKRNQKKRK